jgi:predicted MFS family arabinose efflux permease
VRRRSRFSPAYKNYALVVLTIVYTLNFLDRSLIILLLQPIKEDLDLSDTQLGFVTGIAFGLFYAVLGVPLARWADRGNRATITALAMTVWGAAVMCSMFITNFAQLAIARVSAATGEAGAMPPTYSLIGDYFTKASERTRAMAIYLLAAPVAALISFVAGGWLNEQFGWRLTFLILGAPALVVAILVKATIREPRRFGQHAIVPRQRPMREVLTVLWRQDTARRLGIAFVLISTMGLGLGPWYAAFMMRSHDMGSAELGLWLGLIFGVAGIAGTLLGGHIVAKWYAHDPRGQLRLTAIIVALLLPCFVAFLLGPERYQALVALTPLVVVFNFFLGPTFALMQRLTGEDMRATTLALYMLAANLIGMGLGPQIVGVLSDALAPQVGEDSLRYAMLAMSGVALLSAWQFWRAGDSAAEDVNAVRESSALDAEAEAND